MRPRPSCVRAARANPGCAWMDSPVHPTSSMSTASLQHTRASAPMHGILLLGSVMLLAAVSAHALAIADAGGAGKRIYREGVLPSGEALRGTVRNGVVVS